VDAGGCSGAREPAVPGWMGGCLERRQATGRSESAMCSFFVCSCVGVRPPTLADLFFLFVTAALCSLLVCEHLQVLSGSPKKQSAVRARPAASSSSSSGRKSCAAVPQLWTPPTPRPRAAYLASALPGIGPSWHRPCRSHYPGSPQIHRTEQPSAEHRCPHHSQPQHCEVLYINVLAAV